MDGHQVSLAGSGGATGGGRTGAGRRDQYRPTQADRSRGLPNAAEPRRQLPKTLERAPHMTNVIVTRFCSLQASLKTVKIEIKVHTSGASARQYCAVLGLGGYSVKTVCDCVQSVSILTAHCLRVAMRIFCTKSDVLPYFLLLFGSQKR